MVIQISGCKIEGLGNIPAQADRSFQYLLLRFLLGTAAASRGAVGGKQPIDYSSLPAVAQTKKPTAALSDFLISYSVGGNAARFIRVTIADNRGFYREILSEFLNCHLQTIQGRHTGAFVFLYRVLERASFSVPLLYASTQTDYIGTFNDLKAILNADKDGEIGLFKKFLNQGRFIDRLKLQVNQKISFASASGNARAHFEIATKKFKKFSSTDEANNEVEVVFSDIPDLLVTLRNRFFHSRTGDGMNNINSTEMPDSDEFFGCVNPVIFSFLSIVVLQTLATKYRM